MKLVASNRCSNSGIKFGILQLSSRMKDKAEKTHGTMNQKNAENLTFSMHKFLLCPTASHAQTHQFGVHEHVSLVHTWQQHQSRVCLEQAATVRFIHSCPPLFPPEPGGSFTISALLRHPNCHSLNFKKVLNRNFKLGSKQSNTEIMKHQ